MAAGRTRVPINSMNTTNCMLKQKVPHRSRTSTSSIRLWTVLLIHRLRCDSRTLNSSGTTVLQTACGTKTCFRLGNVLSISVDRYRSSPRCSRLPCSSPRIWISTCRARRTYRISQDRHPVVLTTLGSLDAVHAETTRQASNTTKD